MKHRLFFFIALLAAVVLPQTAAAYDFSAVSLHGQTLYYTIEDSHNGIVKVTYPGTRQNRWTGYEKPVGHVVIPDNVTYNGELYFVQTIDDYAFAGCTELSGVTFLCIGHIGNYAFSQCTSLAFVRFNNICSWADTLSIGDHAFYRCSWLGSDAEEGFDLPSYTTRIGPNAFTSCHWITEITIPESVTSIGEKAFYNCDRLATVHFNATHCTTMGSATNPVFKNCNALASLTVGPTVTQIPSYAFMGLTGIRYINFPSTLSVIGDSAFYGCTNLAWQVDGLNIPRSVTSIGKGAFANCTQMETLHLVGLEGYGRPRLKTIGNKAFQGCTGLTDAITIPDSVSSIGAGAFQGCTGLTEVHFNAMNCTSMGSSGLSVFEGCTGLTTLTIGSNVTTIPDNAFYYRRSVTGTLTLPASLTSIGKKAFENCSGLTGTLVLPNGITQIGDYAFSGCTGLTGALTIPEAVTRIGASAFYGCSGLTAVNFNAVNCSTLGSYSSYAFNSCTNLHTLTIGPNVTIIPNYAFRECSHLTGTLTIPEAVATLGEDAFYGCSGLTAVNFNAVNCTTRANTYHQPFTGCTGIASVTIGSSVTTIPDYTFFGLSALTGAVHFPESVTLIGASAFTGSGINEIYIGKNMAEIGSSAFWNCGNLTNVRMTSVNPPHIYPSTFPENNPVVNIIVPCGLLERYQYAWGDSYNYVSGGSVDLTFQQEACDSYTWPLNGVTYTQTPDADPTVTWTDEASGCVTTATLQLTIKGRRSHTYVTNCGPYYWDLTDKTYNKSGLKFYKGTTEDGCLIRDTLELTLVDKFSSHTYVTHCGPYHWDKTDKTYNKSGLKFYKGTSEGGCPIRDTLELTVIDRYHSYTQVEHCGPYYWDKTDKTYNKSGMKFYKGVSDDGCPIRDTLDLKVVDRWSSRDTVVSCDGAYTWDKTGQTYKKTGMKFYKGVSDDGCPIRDTLYVIISQSAHSYNEVTSYGPYTWALTGKTYNKSGLKFNKGTNEYGCPIRDTLNLTVLPANAAPESPILNSQFSTLNSLKVFPNPTTGVIHLSFDNSKIELLDLVGRCVAVFENTNTLDLSGLADGTYTLRVTLPEGVVLKKVVKK